MPFYNDLRPESDFADRDFALVFPGMETAEKIRTIDGLLRLKAGLEADIRSKAPREADRTLLIASWNLKEFGHLTKRLPEAYFYIAEILSCFDLIAVQEVKSTMVDLNRIMRLLGSDWSYLVSDITDGASGNRERSCYIYNEKRVVPSGLVGEITLWPELTEGAALRQLKRTPYMTGFKAGWKRFTLVNLHLHPGDDQTDVAFRQAEVRLLLAALQKKDPLLWTRNLILVGDMNLYAGDDDATVALFAQAQYRECEALVGQDTNVGLSQAYDRMFFHRTEYFRMSRDAVGQEVGGVFNLFEHVFRDEDRQDYKTKMQEHYTGTRRDLENSDADLLAYYRQTWRRNQVSDHLPIWVSLTIDDSSRFLVDKRDSLDGDT